MSSSPESTPTLEKNDNDKDELVVKRVVRERGSSRPKEIVVEKSGVECVVTPRQVVKIDPEDLGDFDKPEPAKTRDVPNQQEENQKQEKAEQNVEQANTTESGEQTIFQKVSTTCSNAYESAKNWFKSFF